MPSVEKKAYKRELSLALLVAYSATALTMAFAYLVFEKHIVSTVVWSSLGPTVPSTMLFLYLRVRAGTGHITRHMACDLLDKVNCIPLGFWAVTLSGNIVIGVGAAQIHQRPTPYALVALIVLFIGLLAGSMFAWNRIARLLLRKFPWPS
jgi:hypothetical protein